MAKECKICGASYERDKRTAKGLCSPCAFWSLVDKTVSPCGCWLWNSTISSGGYGVFRWPVPVGRPEIFTHRVAWILTNGAIPDGICVLHGCDGLYNVGDITNRRCVNPAHLRLGTHAENAKDRDVSGRTARGLLSGAVLHPDSLARGLANGSYTHPERLARGDRNGTRLHPESLPRGDLHHSRLRPDRLARGVNGGTSKLNDELVREIRASSKPLSVLAQRLGVHLSTIHRVRIGRTWNHVT